MEKYCYFSPANCAPILPMSFLRKLSEKHGLIYRFILFVGTVALLVFLLPKEAEFQYNFEAERPWPYEDLYAPFEFTILLDEDEVALKDSAITADFQPYYELDHDIEDEQRSLFRQKLESNWDDCEYAAENQGSFLTFNKEKKDSIAMERHREVGEKILDKIYDKGLIKLDEQHDEMPDDFELYLVDKGEAKLKEIKDLYSEKTAWEYAEGKLDREDKIDEAFLLELIRLSLTHNVSYDGEKSDDLLAEKLDYPRTIGMIKFQEKVIGRGDLVTKRKVQILQSLKAEFQKQLRGSQEYYVILSGQIILISLCIFALYAFLFLFRKEFLRNNRKVTFVLMLMVLMAFSTKVALQIDNIEVFLVPLCLLPIVIRAFFDAILALFVHVVAVLAISFMVDGAFDFVFLHLIAGVVAIFSISNLRRRSQFFISVGIIFVVYILIYAALEVLGEGRFETERLYTLAWFGGNAALTLFSFPLIYICEKTFGFVSETTLIELSDTNNPLLRDLAEKTPGTFQHTMQVANLAEEAIREIDGDALLVRTGALYHDIGKMANPLYFIENQSGGINPHDELSYDESARIIIDHVINGIEMAKKRGLPEVLIDFIRTHHGTSRTEYFYRMFKKEHGEDEEVDDAPFRYPGPLPYSKETAVLMMADAVEAASRSLKHYDTETIDKLVEGIINGQMGHGQFVNANITFRDITDIKKIFKRKLVNIYHARIEYPK